MILDFSQMIPIKGHVNIREALIENLKIIIAIKPLQYLFRSQGKTNLQELSLLAEGTIGNDVFKMLQQQQLKIIPKFEEHDMKHIILGYSMSSIDEIRMQAYLLGNGHYSIFCVVFLASGMLFPEHWNSFYKDYKKGKKSASISKLVFENCKSRYTKDLRAMYAPKNHI